MEGLAKWFDCGVLLEPNLILNLVVASIFKFCIVHCDSCWQDPDVKVLTIWQYLACQSLVVLSDYNSFYGK